MKDVARPPKVPLAFDRVFPLSATGERHFIPNVPLIHDYLMQLGIISKQLMMELVNRAKRIFDKEANLLRVNGASHIFGDIHGQLFDLIPMLDKL